MINDSSLCVILPFRSILQIRNAGLSTLRPQFLLFEVGFSINSSRGWPIRSGVSHPYFLQGFNDHSVNFVLEFIQIDIVFFNVIGFTEDVNGVSGQHGCQL